MNSVPNANDDRRLAQARVASVQACARIAGVPNPTSGADPDELPYDEEPTRVKV